MNKTASYESLVGSLEGYLAKDGSSVKAAEEQGSTEKPAPSIEGSDSETKEILPEGSHERGSTPTNDITGKPGVPVGTPVPGQPSPPEEEEKKEEVSPDSKVASDADAEPVEEGKDKFASILAELRGDEVVEPAEPKTAAEESAEEGTPKEAGEAATPADAKSDPEIAGLSGNGNEGADPKNTEDTSGNPPAETGAGSNSSPGHSMKEAGLSDEDVDALTRKVAAFIEDQQYAAAMAGQLIENTFGVQMTGQKTAAVTPEPTDEQKVAYTELETRVNAKVAELASQGLSKEEITEQITKIAMDEGAALVAPPEEAPPAPAPEGMPPEAAPAPEGMPPEGGQPMPPEGGGQPMPSPEEIVMILEQLVQAGQITPEEAIQAAEIIDQQLNGGGGAPPMEDPAAAGPPVEEAPPAEGPPAEGGGEAPPKEESSDDGGEKKEESSDDEKKEAADKDFARGQEIAGLINQKFAELRDGPTALENTKIALLKGQDASEESIKAMMGSVAAKKEAGEKVSQTDNPSIQDAFLAIDTLVDGGHIPHTKAAEALEELTEKGDFTKVAAIIKTAQALDTFSKVAAAEPLPPEAGSAPVPPVPGGDPAMAAPPMPPEGGAPAPGPEGGAPAGDPTAAIDQLLGALEQLVVAGVIGEEQAVQMVQGLGIAPPDAGGGAPPMGDPAAGGGEPPMPPEAAPPVA